MALPTPRPDTTCLVTGASSGIGREIARELARRGHGVTLVARRDVDLRDLADEVAAAHRVRAEVVPADLTDPAARAGLVDEIRRRGLHVEVLVNNAGVGTAGPVVRADREAELAMIRLDVEAVADLCVLFLPAMVDRHHGAVLNVASVASFQPLPGQAGYGACKAFVLSYSQALQGELRGQPITVTAVCPGPVATGFGEAAGISDDDAHVLPSFMWVSAEAVARAAVDGLDHGRPLVIPGFGNVVGATLGRFAPRSVLVPLLARQHPSLRP